MCVFARRKVPDSATFDICSKRGCMTGMSELIKAMLCSHSRPIKSESEQQSDNRKKVRLQKLAFSRFVLIKGKKCAGSRMNV